METPSQLKRRQKRHTFFITLIILTVPLYILGFAILQIAPDSNVDEYAILPSEAPPKVSTILPRTTPTQKSMSPTFEMITVSTATIVPINNTNVVANTIMPTHTASTTTTNTPTSTASTTPTSSNTASPTYTGTYTPTSSLTPTATPSHTIIAPTKTNTVTPQPSNTPTLP